MGLILKQLGIFNGVTPSEKNAEFITARFTIDECYKGNSIAASSLNKPNIVVPFNITKNSKLVDALNALTTGASCHLTLDADIEPANGNYKAKMKFDLMEVKPLPQSKPS